MLGKNVKLRYGIVVSMLAAISIATGGYFFAMNNAGAEIAGVNATQVSDIVKADAADDTETGDGTEDAGEVQKDDIVDFHLVATYTGYGNDKSGLVTFTDVLPEYMELVTGTQTVQGTSKDCTPTITNTCGVTWADSNNPYTYDSTTRTFKAQVSGIPASQGADTGNVVDIHLWAKVTEDAESLTTKLQKKIENVYYTNYVTVTHAAASSVSNKVQFHSGNVSDETYTIKYRFKDGSPVPTGVTAPTDDSKYGKGSEVTIQPNMKAQGYKFSGWKLVTTNLQSENYTWDDEILKFVLNLGTTDVNEVIFEGEWTENRKIDVNYAWQGKESDLASDDSADDKPTVDVPQSAQVYEDASIKLPSYPATKNEIDAGGSYDSSKDSYSDLYKQYTFLGWKVTLNYSDDTTEEQELTQAEINAKEFSPSPAEGKTLNSVTLTGYWTKTTFSVTTAVEGTDGGVWPDGTTQPTFDDGIKWGTNLTLPVMNPTSGYRFNGWKLEPDLGAGADSADGGKQYTMPVSNVTATASFTKTYKVTMTSATASTSNATEGSEIDAAPGEVVTIKPLENLEDVRFNEWDTTLTADANNWILNDDNTATFVMPNIDVAIAGKYQLETDFLVVNGTWSDGTTGFKSEFVDVTQQVDKSWAGTLQSSQVPNDMKADFSHEQNSGGWGDKSTAAQNPNNFIGANKITATEGGKANQLTLFTYTFTDTLANITITYNVKSGHEDYGTVKYNEKGATAGTKASESIDPLGVKSTPKGATATAETGYKFAFWSKDKDEEAFTVEANFVPFKVVNTGGTTEFYEKADYYANFEPNKFTIKFDSNKGNGSSTPTGTMEDQEIAYKSGDKLKTNTFKRTGYVFTGWNTMEDGLGTDFEDGADGSQISTEDGEEVTLYAQWKAQTVTVNYNGVKTGVTSSSASNIANTMASSTFTYDVASQKLKDNAFALTGYHFVHWSENNTAGASGIQVKAFDNSAAITNDWIATKAGTNETATVNLYSYWNANTYKVTYKPNKGSGAEEVTGAEYTQNFTYDVGNSLTANKFTRKGYIFKGWATASGSSTVVHENLKTVSNLTAAQDGNVDLYAVWSVQTVTVKYNSYKGNYVTSSTFTGTMADQTVTYDNTSSQTLKANDFGLEGYKFTHWASATPSIATKYKDDKATLTNAEIATLCGTNENVVLNLYTYWTPIKFTITFNANDSVGATKVTVNTGYSNPYKQEYTYDVRQNLTSLQYNRKGYVFKGWSDSASSTDVKYSNNQQNVGNLTATDGGNINLYAVWSVQKVTVNYNGVTTGLTTASTIQNSMTASTFTYDQTSTQTLKSNTYLLTGYRFTHWSESNTAGAANIGKKAFDNSATITNDWIAQKCGNNETATVNLYTYWTANDYTVTFHANKGSGAESVVPAEDYTQNFKYDTAQNLTAVKFKRTGYVFKGWATSANSSNVVHVDGKSVNNLTNVQNGKVDLYAVWQVQKLTVKFEGVITGLDTRNYIEGSTAQKVFTYDGGEQKLTKNGFTLLGYTFTHWSETNTEEGIKTAFKTDEAVLTNADIAAKCGTKETAEITLYTYWTPLTYTVVFDKNEVAGKSAVEGSTASMTVKYDETVMLTKNGYTRTGYTWKGWDTDKDKDPDQSTTYDDQAYIQNLSETIDSEGNYSVKSSVTLYAIWKVNTYNVQYFGNAVGVTGSMSVQTVNYDETSEVLANGFRRYGYTFAGWNSQANGKGTAYAAGDEIKNLVSTANGNFPLYAQWKANDYTVRYDLNDGVHGTDPEANPSSYDDKIVQWNSRGLTSGKTPTRPGYTFSGWVKKGTSTSVGTNTDYYYLRDNNAGVYDDSTSTIVTLEATWTENADITISYETDFSAIPNQQQVGSLDKGSETLKPATGTPAGATAQNITAGYKVKEWRIKGIDGDAGKVQDGGNTYVPTKNTDLIYEAKTYVAVFDVDIAKYKIKYYQEQADGTWNEVAADAREFEKHSNEVPDYSATNFNTGDTLAKTYDGYAATPAVKYWSNTAKGTDGRGTDAVQNVQPDGSLEIRAYYSRNKYNITFNTQGHGSVTNPAANTGLRWGNKVTRPTDPVEAGWTFGGWFTDAACSAANAWNFDTLTTNANGNITLYAKWTQNTYTVKYEVGKGATNSSAFGDKTGVTWAQTGLLPSATPLRKGYTFKNWTVSGDIQNREITASSAYSVMAGNVGGTDKTAEVTLKANYTKDQKDNTGTKTGNVTVYANDIRMSVEEATVLLAKNNASQLSDILAKSDAFAEQDDETPVAITKLEHTIKAKAGQYEFTLSTAAGASVEAKAFVYDTTTTTGKAAIGAQNFSVSVDQVTNLKLNSATEGKQNLIGLAHAKAWNTDTRENLAIASVTTGVVATEGVYDVTFVSSNLNGSTATVTVKCTVYSKGVADNTYRITGHDFSIKKGTAVTDEDIVSLGNAKAFEVQTGNEVEVAVRRHVNGIEFDPNKVGKYTIRYYAASSDGYAELDVVATVYDDAVETNGEVISANGFSIAKDQVNASLTDAKLIELANASAYEKETGKSVNVTVKDRGGLKAEKGTYKVTFKTAKGTETTVDVKVTDNEQTKDGIRISANDFTISVDEVKNNIFKGGTTPDKDALVSYAKASATKVSDNSDIGIASVTSSPALEAKKGTYVLTFTSNTLGGKTAVTSCKMTVNDNTGIQNGIRLDANDFTVSVKQVQEESLSGANANLANLIKRAKATASLEADGAAVPITAATSQIKAEKGTYDVTFTATYGDKTAQATIHVTVTDNSGESENPDSPDAIKIDANGFTLSVAEATTLAGQTGDTQKKALIDYAQAKASKISDGSEIEVSEATTTVQGKKGEYAATFKAVNNGQTAEITVVVKVVENAVRDNKDVDIYASGFSVTAKQVADEKLNNNTEGLQALIKYANASAVLKKDQSNVGIASVQSHIRTEKGTYDVIFTSNVPDGGTAATITIKAKVTDNQTVTDDGLTISANNFTVSVEEAKTLGATNPDKDKLIQLANAHAEDKTGASIGIASVTSTIEPKVGTYTVIFTSNTVNEKSVSQEVTATVTDKSESSSTIKLDANNFTVSIDEVKTHKLNSNTEGKAKLIEFAHAHAELISDGTFVDIASVNTLIQPKVGTYDVTFTTAAPTGTTAVSLKVKANVVSSAVDPNPGDKDGVRAYATDFSISKADVEAQKLHEKPLTDTAKNKLIELAKARVVKVLDGSEVAIDKATITSDIVNAKGKYKVTFTSAAVNGKTATAVAWAQVTDGSSSGEITDPDNPDNNDKINLNANNFELTVSDAEALNNLGNSDKLAKLIEYAHASATLESDGSAVDIVSATGTIKEEKGTYKITFKTAAIKGVSAELSVWATVNTNSGGSEDIDDPNKPGGKDKINIYASDFSVSIADVTKDNLSGSSASLDNLIARAKAKAEMASDGRAVKVASVTSAIEAVKGTYDVTFTTEAVSNKTASITIKATVTDNTGGSGEITDPDPDRPSGTDKINIYANDFSVSVKDVTAKSLSNGTTALADLIKLANARAEWASDGAAVDVVKADSEIKVAKGTYKVTFTSKAFKNVSASVSIWATVTDDSGTSGEITDPDVPGGKDTINIYANNFDISVKDVEAMKKLDDAGQLKALIGYAKARASFASNGQAVDIVSAETEIAPAKGTYDIKFTSKAYNNIAASITIKSNVVDNSDNSGEIEDPDAPNGKDTINIYANDFSVSISDVKAKNLSDNNAGLQNLIALAKARASWASNGATVTIASVDSKIEAAKGTYDVVFKSAELGGRSANITVKATVTDKSSSGGDITDPTKPGGVDKINIFASDFSISASAVEELLKKSADDKLASLIGYAHASASMDSDGSAVKIVSAETALVAAKGTYAVKFTTETIKETKAELKINATVTDGSGNSGDIVDPSVPGGKDSINIYANDFSISVADVTAKNLVNNNQVALPELIKLAKARAEWASNGAAVDVATVDTNILAEKGVYSVIFKSVEINGKSASITVKATVTDKSATGGEVTDPDNPDADPNDPASKVHINIYANDFTVSAKDVTDNSLDNGATGKDKLIELAKARAEYSKDASAIDIASVTSDIKAERGTYAVTFKSAAKGTVPAVEISVTATVVDNSSSGETTDPNPDTGKKDKINVYANGFSVSVADVTADNLGGNTPNLDNLIARARAKAELESSGQSVKITSVASGIKAVKGTYDVTFTTESVLNATGSITVKATVTDKSSFGEEVVDPDVPDVDPDDPDAPKVKINMYANDFSVSVADVVSGKLTDNNAGKDNLIGLANARAEYSKDASNVKVASVESGLKAEKGTYTVRFTSATRGTVPAAEITVNATVTDGSGTTGEITDPNPTDPDNPRKDTVNIYANSFNVSVKEVRDKIMTANGYNNDALISYAKARASLASDGSDYGVAKVETSMKDVKGTYDVKFTSNELFGKSASITIKAIVTDNSATGEEVVDPDNPGADPTDPANKVHINIYANDFSVSVDDVNNGTLTSGDAGKAKLIELANAKAEYSKDGSAIDIESVESGIEAEKGTYTVKFKSAAKGTVPAVEIIVTATVTDKSGKGEEVVDPDQPNPKPDPSTPDVKVHINIYANDFTVSLKDVQDNSLGDSTNGKAKLIELAKARAEYSNDGSSIEVSTVDSSIEAKRGTYDVKFVSATKGSVPAAEVTVKATVTDSSAEDSGTTEDGKTDGVKAYANNFTVSVKEVENGNLGDESATGVLDKLVKYAGAKAERVLDGSAVNIASAESNIQDVKGQYEVSFTSEKVGEKEATVKVVATVVDHASRGDVDNPETPVPGANKSDQISIYANDFNMTVAEVEAITAGKSALTPDGAKKLIEYAGARAEKIVDRSEVGINSVDTEIKAQKGTYDVKFTSEADDNNRVASTTVKVTVTDNGTRGNNVDIFANDFTVSVAEVKADKLTDGSESAGMTSLIKRAGAYAIDKFGGAVDIDSVESSILAKSGKYDVVFTTAEVDGEAINVKIRATVKDSATEDTTNGERITANNFSLSMGEATAIVNGTTSAADAKTMLVNLANAEASNIADGSAVDVTSVDYTALKAAVANYKITFATAKGTSVTVLAKVSDNVVVVGNVAVDAHDFTVSVAEVNTLKLDDGDAGKDSLVSLAQARAWDTNTKEPIDFSNVTTEVQAKRGDYDVTFEATNGTVTNSITVVAKVRDKKVDPSNPDPKPDPDPDNPDQPKPSPDPDQPVPGPDDADVDIVLYANDFAVSVQEVNDFNLTDGTASLDKLVELADAEAFKHSDYNPVAIAKATSTIKAAKGEYTVEFETEAVDDKTLKIEVVAKVYDNSATTTDPTDPTKGVVIKGNDFSLSKAEADAIVSGGVYSFSSVPKAFAAGTEMDDGSKELIRLAGVVAYNIKDHSEVDVIKVNFPYAGEVGKYTVTFTAESGNITGKLDVTGTVTNESYEDKENKERISANNISYTYEEAQELLSKSNDEIATQLAQDASASAVSTVDGSAVDVVNAEWDIQVAEGVYNVKFSTEKGTSVTVKAAVGEKPLDPSALAALSKTEDNMFAYIAIAVLIVLISSLAVVFVARRRKQQQ